MDREAWWATVHGVAKSRTRLSDFTFFFLLSIYMYIYTYIQMVGIYTKSMTVVSRDWAEEKELGWEQLLSVLFNLFYINATEANMINC